MTKFIPVLFLATLFFTAKLSAQPANCNVPILVRNHYIGSAKTLAFRQMLGDPAWADSVEIPALLSDPMLKALSSVFNATQYLERDTVTECLDILAAGSPFSPTGLTMTADTSFSWAKKLHQGVFPTGNSIVDDLLYRYQLRKTGSYQLGKFFFFFESAELLNTVALAKRFNIIPGVYANANGGIGDGNDILIDTITGGLQLTYVVGWGDCPAGCIFERRWSFLAKPNCSVEFLGVQGDALTAEIACNSNYSCYTGSLCLAWLQDSLQHYLAQFPNCPATEPTLSLTLYQEFNTPPVFGIHLFLAADAQFTDFFNCDGSSIGHCFSGVSGLLLCNPDYLTTFQNGDVIWACDEPLPTPANCASATQEVFADGLSFQLLPNPTSTGQVVLQADFGHTAKGRLSVLNVFGKCVLEQTFEAEQLAEELHLEGQNPGLYFVRLEEGTRSVVRKLVLLAP